MSFLRNLVERHEKTLLIGIGALGLTSVLAGFEFSILEAKLYDFRMTRGSMPSPSQEIVLIELDDTTTRALDDYAPLSLDVHTSFLQKLSRLNPKAVGYLVNMNHVNQVNPDHFQNAWADMFIHTVREMESRGIPFVFGTPFDVNGEVLPPYPLSSLRHSIAVIHRDGNVFANDNVTRRGLTRLYGRPTFHLTLAEAAGLVPKDYVPSGAFEVRESDAQYFFFRYHGSTAIPALGSLVGETDNGYKRLSYIDVLEERLPEDALKGKIVLVGTLSRQNPGDFALTPFSHSPFVNPKLIIHANILDSIIHDDGILMTPKWLTWITTLLVTGFVLWWVLTSTPLYGVFATLGLGIAVLLAGQLLFQVIGPFKGVWLQQSQPLVAVAVAYYIVVPYRLIREYKKRWDYQRRNEILTQVEELKTNFLSLVTHDLKTPVARIQGLAEVLLSKASDRLIERDRETIDHIIASTDELNRFISSILELTKIESNRLRLNLESKDVNQLIERSVEGFKAQARASRKRILCELEPLFPIKMDPHLISKVLNNLIDNALKYSPEGSEIVIRSREIEDWVEISVRDQGIGMTGSELENLFTRFFRAKNDTTSKVSGTGLGLYLTKYFVEAHLGRVEVDSELEKGSTFRIFLPLVLDEAAVAERFRPEFAERVGRLAFGEAGGLRLGKFLKRFESKERARSLRQEEKNTKKKETANV